MTLPIAWLDHSEYERRRTNELLRQFEEKDTVDELGIGTIRDALSDRLFPGTSIIQTRARYFLFVSWMYVRLEKQRVKSDRIERVARDFEIALVEPLLASDDPAGTIGKVARHTLKTLPSAIYWQGLRRWGIRSFQGNRAAYHASLTDAYYRRLASARNSSDEDMALPMPRNWHAGLPDAPADFPEGVSHALSHAEATYLAERIKQTNPRSLLAFLATAAYSAADSETPWNHQHYSAFPAWNKRELAHARAFSLVMRGAPLLYNLEVSERKGKKDWCDKYATMLSEWQKEIAVSRSALIDWNVNDFWQLIAEENPAVAPPAREFVHQWVDLIVNRKTTATSKECRSLIVDRERAIKGRLARVDSPRTRELWQGSSGIRAMDYRWTNIVQQLLADIHAGLERDA